MFERLTLHGTAATILSGYREAAVLRSWCIVKLLGGAWTLSATTARVNPLELRGRELLFIAPRKGGFFTWPVKSIERTGPSSVTATLGPPEQ